MVGVEKGVEETRKKLSELMCSRLNMCMKKLIKETFLLFFSLTSTGESNGFRSNLARMLLHAFMT